MRGNSYVPFMLRRGDGSTLSLDFTTMGSLDSRFTFTRASTATYINSGGLVTTMAAASTNDPTKARFDYDPTTLAPRGLLIEGSATNLINWSETFDTTGGATNWNWSALNVTRGTVTTTNPTGASATVIKIEETTANGIHATLIVPTVLASTTYTFSVWAKAVERTFVQLLENGGSGANSMVNLSTGAIVSESTAGITTVSAFGSTGWYRISMRLTTIVGQTTANCQLRLSTNGTTTSYAGTTGSGIYIWGAQLETGSGASSYIPTGSSTVQRAAESCQMTGTNFSSWFGSPTSATVYAEAFANIIPPASNFPGIWLMNKSGNARNYGYVRHSTANLRVAGFNAATGGTITDIDTNPVTAVTAGTRFKHAVAMSDLNWSYAANAGSGVNTNTNTTVYFDETVDSLTIGLAPGQLGSHTIAKLKYWPIALPTATLQALTA